MWTIYTNVPITRRKTFHLVADPTGEVQFKHRHFWPCIEWLDAEGIEAYLIRCGYDPDAKGPLIARKQEGT